MAKTILCYRADRPGSLLRVDVEVYNQEVEAAEEQGRPCIWVDADQDAEVGGPSYDQLDEAGKAEVDERQAAKAAAK